MRGGMDEDQQQVVIRDLGVLSDQFSEAPLPVRPRRRLSKRLRGAVLTAGMVGFVVVAGDDPGSSEPPHAMVERSDVCDVITAVQERVVTEQPSGHGRSTGIASQPVSAIPVSGDVVIPSDISMTVFQVDTVTGRDVPFALVDSSGFWEFCSKSTELTALEESPYPSEDELGELPDGMSYVYRQDDLTTTTYDVAGIRLRDGSVVDSVTLQDGRTLPLQAPTS